MYTYIIFSARRYIALVAIIVKIRICSAKIARNEQVCAHENSKSYTGSKFS